MARRSGLGKGLSSLIPPGEAAPTGSDEAPILIDIPVADITPNRHQPRVHFDEESLSELTASIHQLGVLQPVLVRPSESGTGYELIAGERRWRAASRAGLATIPALVRRTDDLAVVEQALVENLHRQDLTPLEEAAAFQQLVDDFGLTHEQIAERVGKSRSAITNTLRLLGLPPSIQHLLADAKLSAGHARALLATPDRGLQEQLARRAVEEGWNVRMTEEAVRRGGVQLPSDDEDAPGPAPIAPSHDGAGLAPSTRLRPPGLLELEELLAGYLDTRVNVQMSAKRGRVAIDFADLADLERIYRRMTGE
jgi:ParB family transcriptional regulator, chromosome partitioning protein